eukprot:NODE_607_length_6164_cov_0.344930.p2 type:complete len:324 gc:universal NODE_607_length_6164_cov_0.344930:5020-4049(-)
MNLTSLENYTFQVCIATIWKRHYDGMNKQSLQLMTSVLARYILQLGKLSSYFANYAGRCDIQLDDVLWALEEVGVDYHDLLNGYVRQESMYEFVDVEEMETIVPQTRTTDENIPSHLPAYPEKDAVKTSYTPAQVDVLPIKAEIDEIINKDAPPLPAGLFSAKTEQLKSIFNLSAPSLLDSLYDCMNEAEVIMADKTEEIEMQRNSAKIVRKQLYLNAIKSNPFLTDDVGTHSDHYQYSTLFPFSSHFEVPNTATIDTSARTSNTISDIPPGWLLAPHNINFRPVHQLATSEMNDWNDFIEDDNEELEKTYRNSYVDAIMAQK